MPSDTRALLRIFLWAGVVALVLMAVLAAAAVGRLNHEVAAGVGLGVLVIGGILVGRFGSRGLLAPRKPRNPDAEPQYRSNKHNDSLQE
jgi:hypothetical protein